MTQSHALVGIDVAKRTLEWCCREGPRGKAENSEAGCAALARELADHRITTAVLEASGGYERVPAVVLRDAGFVVRIVDPKRVRRFAEAGGRPAKNDRLDALTIAWFGETFADQGKPEPDPAREELARLMAERLDFVDMRVQLLNRAEHLGSAVGGRQRKLLLAGFDRAIKRLDAAIAKQLARSSSLAEDARLLATVPGLGAVVVAGLVAWLPELGRIGHKEIAALVGVAPYDDDTGQHHGLRHIAGGRQALRNLLYMATLGAATRHNPTLRAFYTRLRAKGKAGKVALIACMRKLLVILNTMLARREPWNPALLPADTP